MIVQNLLIGALDATNTSIDKEGEYTAERGFL
jgi:hypothetical protein